jgi:hypothetical protein
MEWSGRAPAPPAKPIGSAMSYEADVRRASHLILLVKEGFAASLSEAATRVCALASGHGHNSGRHSDATAVRGRAGRGPKGPTAACRA